MSVLLSGTLRPETSPQVYPCVPVAPDNQKTLLANQSQVFSCPMGKNWVIIVVLISVEERNLSEILYQLEILKTMSFLFC